MASWSTPPCHIGYRKLNNARRYAIDAEQVLRLSETVAISNLFTTLLPFEFCNTRSASVQRPNTGGPTLPAHGTQPFGRILLNPGEETMLVTFSIVRQKIAYTNSFIPYEKSARICQSLHSFLALCRFDRTSKSHSRRVQSSPGYLHVGQVPSNWTRHIPQTSSSGISHRQEATAFHSLMVTFMA